MNGGLFKIIREKKAEIKKFKNEQFNKAQLKNNLVQMRSRTLVNYITFHFPKDGQDYLSNKSKI